MPAELGPFKTSLRVDVLSRRSRRTPAELLTAAEAIALHATSFAPLTRATRVACYLSMSDEPGSGPLIEMLRAQGVDVIVPIVETGHTLDWAHHDGHTVSGRFGIEVPTGPRLGPDALADCEVAVIPALAIDHAGHRLGRGAGYYDRALADHDLTRCALVFEDELFPELPHEDHDVPVHAAITPAGVFRVPPADPAGGR